MVNEKKRRVRSPEERTLRKEWNDEFENISSNTQGTPRRPDYMEERIHRDEVRRQVEKSRPRRKRPASPQAAPRRSEPRPSFDNVQELPRWETPPQRTSPPPRLDTAPPRQTARRKPRRKHRFLPILSILVMAVVTALLVIFLLFPVEDITISGDAIPGVSEEEIVAISGCEVGDNLVFLSAGSMISRLEEQIPYVRTAKIVRHFPGTVEIQLTGADVAACVYSTGGWLYVNEDGKIMDLRDAPQNGVLQIVGLSPDEGQVGQNVTMQDEAALAAYQEILAALAEVRGDTTGSYGGLNNDGFTLLDLSDLTQIKMYYEDRVEFQMGGTAQLNYKVKAGCRFLLEMTSRETGVMDLSTAGDTKRAYFTPGTLTVPTTPGVSADGTADADGDASPDDTTQEPTPEPSQSPREQGIPNTPYTGNGY